MGGQGAGCMDHGWMHVLRISPQDSGSTTALSLASTQSLFAKVKVAQYKESPMSTLLAMMYFADILGLSLFQSQSPINTWETEIHTY